MWLINKKMSLAVKAGIVFSLFALLLLSSIISVLVLQQGANKIDGVRIDIAGRNRMLSQKAALKVTQLGSSNGTQAERQVIQSILKLHDDSYLLLRNGGLTPDGIAIKGSYAEFTKEYDQISAVWTDYERIMQGKLSGQSTDISGLAVLAEDLLKKNNQLVQVLVADYNSRNRTFRNFYLGLCVTSIAVLIVGLRVLRTSLVKPTIAILRHIEKQNQGDFTRRLDIASEDEMGRIATGLNLLSQKMHLLLAGLSDLSKEVISSSESLQDAATKTNENSSFQASSIEEISASLEEMGGSSELNADLSTQTSKKSMLFLEQMDIVRNKSEELNRSLNEINDHIKLIGEISSQTNFLALNAAVEATKAGDRGKGFSVIAREVRELADNTKETTDQITSLILVCVEHARSTQELIVAQEDELKVLIEGMQAIDTSSQEQRHGIQQINVTIESLNQLSQSNAQVASELHGMSSTLGDLTKAMDEKVSSLSDS